MSRVAAGLALLAWMVLQAPISVCLGCETVGDASMRVLGVEGCCTDAGHAHVHAHPHAHTHDGAHHHHGTDEDGAPEGHAVLIAQVVLAPPAVELPSADAAFLVAASALQAIEPAHDPGRRVPRREPSLGAAPPDPVAAADRLIV